MLVLTRTADCGDRSVIQIGDDIQVILISTKGDQVRLGVVAPRDVTVDRSEIAALKSNSLKAGSPHETEYKAH